MHIIFVFVLLTGVFCVQIFKANGNLTQVNLTSGQQLALNNTALLSNSYRIYAPHNHTININCLYTAPKDNSTTEYFYVQLDHTADDTGGEFFYNSGIITKQSLFNYAIIALKTDTIDVEPQGQFQCRIDAVKSSNCRCGWGRQVVFVISLFFRKKNLIEFLSIRMYVYIG